MRGDKNGSLDKVIAVRRRRDNEGDGKGLLSPSPSGEGGGGYGANRHCLMRRRSGQQPN